jgi:hypothetical protein
VDVIGEVTADEQGRPNAQVHVLEVHWPDRRKDLAGQDVTVANLVNATGFDGPGRYILPLVGGDEGVYRVAGLPRSPGFEHTVFFIYPDTPNTRKQLDATPKRAVAEASAGK